MEGNNEKAYPELPQLISIPVQSEIASSFYFVEFIFSDLSRNPSSFPKSTLGNLCLIHQPINILLVPLLSVEDSKKQEKTYFLSLWVCHLVCRSLSSFSEPNTHCVWYSLAIWNNLQDSLTIWNDVCYSLAIWNNVQYSLAISNKGTFVWYQVSPIFPDKL